MIWSSANTRIPYLVCLDRINSVRLSSGHTGLRAAQIIYGKQSWRLRRPTQHGAFLLSFFFVFFVFLSNVAFILFYFFDYLHDFPLFSNLYRFSFDLFWLFFPTFFWVTFFYTYVQNIRGSYTFIFEPAPAQITRAHPAIAIPCCRQESTTAQHSAVSHAQSIEARIIRAGQSATTHASRQSWREQASCRASAARCIVETNEEIEFCPAEKKWYNHKLQVNNTRRLYFQSQYDTTTLLFLFRAYFVSIVWCWFVRQ